MAAGCAGGVGLAPAIPIALEITNPLVIPAARAHTKFQKGRQVYSVNRYDPWCELEIRTVSEQPQRVEPGRFQVRRVQQAFIKDYNTRISAVLAAFTLASTERSEMKRRYSIMVCSGSRSSIQVRLPSSRTFGRMRTP